MSHGPILVMGSTLYRHECRKCGEETLHNPRGCIHCHTLPWTQPIVVTGGARSVLLGRSPRPTERKRPTAREKSRTSRTEAAHAPRSQTTGPRVAGKVGRGARKLTEAQVIEARDQYRQGASLVSLSRGYGVHHTTLSDAILGLTWPHVPGACDRRPRAKSEQTVRDAMRSLRIQPNNQAVRPSSRLQRRDAAVSASITASLSPAEPPCS